MCCRCLSLLLTFFDGAYRKRAMKNTKQNHDRNTNAMLANKKKAVTRMNFVFRCCCFAIVICYQLWQRQTNKKKIDIVKSTTKWEKKKKQQNTWLTKITINMDIKTQKKNCEKGDINKNWNYNKPSNAIAQYIHINWINVNNNKNDVTWKNEKCISEGK